MTSNQEDLVSSAFHEKMDAALFFFNKLDGVYLRGSSLTQDQTNELLYYSDAVIFEFHAALQQLLQLMNLKAGLDLPLQDVGRNNFLDKVRAVRIDLFNLWDEANSSSEIHVLEAYRNYITHHAGSVLLFATVGEDGALVSVSIPIRWRFKKGQPYKVPGGGSIDLLDELRQMAKRLNQLHDELKLK